MSEFVKNMVGYYTPYSKRKEFQADPQQVQTPAAQVPTTPATPATDAIETGRATDAIETGRMDAPETVVDPNDRVKRGTAGGGGATGGGGTQETPTYTPSAMVQAAKAYLDGVISGRPGAFQSKYADQIAALYEQIMNRPKFQYDVNQDPLFQQYRNIYTQGGQQAMQDTLGSAAALTGGYGNSWGNTAGYQAYQNYLRQLNDKIPELEQRAFDRYTQEGQTLRDNLAMNMGLDDTNYGRYRDSMEDWQADRAYGRGAYENDRALDWEQWKYLDALARANSGGSGGVSSAAKSAASNAWSDAVNGGVDGLDLIAPNSGKQSKAPAYDPDAIVQADLKRAQEIAQAMARYQTGITDPDQADAVIWMKNQNNAMKK